MKTLAERFESHVDRSPGQGPNGDCHEWTASRFPPGYGQLAQGRGKPPYRAHRVAYDLAHPDDPLGERECLHSCDNPPCVREEHLHPGTQKENIREMSARGRMNADSLLNLRPGARGHHGAGPLSNRERMAS